MKIVLELAPSEALLLKDGLETLIEVAVENGEKITVSVYREVLRKLDWRKATVEY